MAVTAVVSVEIHQLKNLLAAELKTFGKIRDEVQEVVEKLSLLNEAEREEQSNKNLQFLQKVYNAKDAIEYFALAETYIRRSAFFKKHSLIIASGIKLCREVQDDQINYFKNMSRLKAELRRIREEIKTVEDENPSWAVGQQEGSHSQSWHEQPRQESDAFSAPTREITIFKKDVEEVVKQLTSNSKPRQIISIFGDVGIGKTAHVKIIYNRLKGYKKFSCRAMVGVKKEWLVRDLMMAILQQVNSLKGIAKLKDDVLRERLHDFLMGQTYLIVIRDIKSRELLKDLSGALPDAYNGSRVLITTSNEETASFANASCRYHFKPLDKEDSSKFFISKIWGRKGSPFSPDSMEDLKNKIAESCKGTLQSIALLAGLLSTRKEIYEERSKVFEQHGFVTKSPNI